MFRSCYQISPIRSNFHLNGDRATKPLPATMFLLAFSLTLNAIMQTSGVASRYLRYKSSRVLHNWDQAAHERNPVGHNRRFSFVGFAANRL